VNKTINKPNSPTGLFRCLWQVEETNEGLYSPGNLVYVTLGISGFILDRLNWSRVLIMGVSLGWVWHGLPKLTDLWFCVGYVAVSMLFYLSLISSVLPLHGLRLNWIKARGEEKAFSEFEALLTFVFFHNGIALTHISQQTANTLDTHQQLIPIATLLAALLIFSGAVVKIWSAVVVGLPVYYWKDMFLGRPVGNFVVKGPYRYLNNPMYGIGQLQVYGIALYYHSAYGIFFAATNQLLVFCFYYYAERPFIQQTYKCVGAPRNQLTHLENDI
jgi:preprotein translocase subunit SecG